MRTGSFGALSSSSFADSWSIRCLPLLVYLIGALVDRRTPARHASLQRAAQLGVPTARLPILEHLPELRTRGEGAVKAKLNRLNVTAVFAALLRYAACGDWPTALREALGEHQRHAAEPERRSPV